MKPADLYKTLITSTDDLLSLADWYYESGLIPKSIGNPQAAAVILIKAMALDIEPLEAFRGIQIIAGNPTISPQLGLALVMRSGLLVDWVLEDTGDLARVTLWRRGMEPKTGQFSMRDAAAMGLATKPNWKNQPRVMRQWRAFAAVLRVLFPDVLAGMYFTEEIDPNRDATGTPDLAAVMTQPPNGEAPAESGRLVSIAELEREAGIDPDPEAPAIAMPPILAWGEVGKTPEAKATQDAALKKAAAQVQEITGAGFHSYAPPDLDAAEFEQREALGINQAAAVRAEAAALARAGTNQAQPGDSRKAYEQAKAGTAQPVKAGRPLDPEQVRKHLFYKASAADQYGTLRLNADERTQLTGQVREALTLALLDYKDQGLAVPFMMFLTRGLFARLQDASDGFIQAAHDWLGVKRGESGEYYPTMDGATEARTIAAMVLLDRGIKAE